MRRAITYFSSVSAGETPRFSSQRRRLNRVASGLLLAGAAIAPIAIGLHLIAGPGFFGTFRLAMAVSSVCIATSLVISFPWPEKTKAIRPKSPIREPINSILVDRLFKQSQEIEERLARARPIVLVVCGDPTEGRQLADCLIELGADPIRVPDALSAVDAIVENPGYFTHMVAHLSSIDMPVFRSLVREIREIDDADTAMRVIGVIPYAQVGGDEPLSHLENVSLVRSWPNRARTRIEISSALATLHSNNSEIGKWPKQPNFKSWTPRVVQGGPHSFLGEGSDDLAERT